MHVLGNPFPAASRIAICTVVTSAESAACILKVTNCEGILMANCSEATLKQCSSQMSCPVNVSSTFYRRLSISGQLRQIDALQVVEAVLATIIVVIGASGQRYRRHPITRILFLGATTLFLPIISSVTSTISLEQDYIIPVRTTSLVYNDHGGLSAVAARCLAPDHVGFFIVLASLVQIVMINTSTVVSVDDREGQCKYLFELIVQGIWTLILAVSFVQFDYHNLSVCVLIFTPIGLLFTKIGLKYYAFEMALRSFALGRNPGLVFVYMQQLQAKEAATNQHVEPLAGEGAGDAPPPPLLFMRESEEQVEKHPQGYAFKDDPTTPTLNRNVGLVTTDRVWQLHSSMLPWTTPWLKDLCLSFAMFKLLRCRFARYKLTNSGSVGTLNFFRSLLLRAGEHDRIFGVIMEELSFVHDYYYSSLPIFYAKRFLAILSIFLSLFTIGYCILLAGLIIKLLKKAANINDDQLECEIWCIKGYLVSQIPSSSPRLAGLYFDLVPLLLVVALVVTAEIRDITSYICSNWTKVSLICHYINRNPSSYSLCMQKWVSTLLRCRCKLMKHWDEKMSQCSVLVPYPKKSPIALVYCLLRVPDQRRKVKVPAAVKVSIINAVRRSVINGSLGNGAESLRQSQGGQSLLWACHGKGTADILLTWHIATCILEVKHPYRADGQEQGSPANPSSADYKIAATNLSKYCAYLVSWCSELLPDKNNAWSKSLYKAVKNDAERALAGHVVARSSNPEDEYQKLVDLLGANSKHDVLKDGVKLGMQLAAETINGEEMVWKLLADFWSEMILFVAPSDNLKGHSEAIARGGELITLLWALLFHAGIVSRSGEEDGAAAA